MMMMMMMRLLLTLLMLLHQPREMLRQLFHGSAGLLHNTAKSIPTPRNHVKLASCGGGLFLTNRS